MKKIATFLVVIGISLGVFGQKKKDQEVDIISHEVQLGESVRLISKKYLVDPAEIYKLNKFAVEGVSQGMVLRIPVPRKESPVVVQQEENTNQQENSTIAEKEPEKQVDNQSAEEKPVRAKPEPKTTKTVTVIDRASAITHTVEPKETLYSLSKKYGISVDEIKLTNPELKNGLKIGQAIKIPSTKTLGSNESSIGSQETPTAEIIKQEAVQSAESTITHTVAPKETLYSLSKRYNVTVDEIKQQNTSLLQHGLQIGQVLTIKKGN